MEQAQDPTIFIATFASLADDDDNQIDPDARYAAVMQFTPDIRKLLAVAPAEVAKVQASMHEDYPELAGDDEVEGYDVRVLMGFKRSTLPDILRIYDNLEALNETVADNDVLIGPEADMDLLLPVTPMELQDDISLVLDVHEFWFEGRTPDEVRVRTRSFDYASIPQFLTRYQQEVTNPTPIEEAIEVQLR